MFHIFIIHGAYGHPKENWFPWLQKELEKDGYSVFVPQFPTPERQTLKNWEQVFEKYIPTVSENTIFVGHSMGAPFVLRILEKVPRPISAAFLVAGAAKGCPKEFKPDSFVNRQFDWKKIRANCRRFYVFHADNDPYNSLETAEKRAEHLDTEVIVIKNGGHLNAEAGYTEFLKLLEQIKMLTEFFTCIQ